MTILVGSNVTTNLTVTSNYTNAFIWYKQYTAVASGTADTLYFWGWSQGNSANMKLCIWNATGTLLQASTIIQNTGSTSLHWYSAPISPVSIVSGTVYCLGFCADAYVGGGDDHLNTGQDNATNSYPTVNNVAPSTDPSNQTILMYASAAPITVPLSYFVIG